MNWNVLFKKKILKKIKKLPVNVQEVLESLIVDLQDGGPVRGDWPNYSKLSKDMYHCHLNYSYVAVWKIVSKQLKIIEVTYVGSRESAPY